MRLLFGISVVLILVIIFFVYKLAVKSDRTDIHIAGLLVSILTLTAYNTTVLMYYNRM
jgi:hypothetical protein